jgi:hypothetical protein
MEGHECGYGLWKSRLVSDPDWAERLLEICAELREFGFADILAHLAWSSTVFGDCHEAYEKLLDTSIKPALYLSMLAF